MSGNLTVSGNVNSGGVLSSQISGTPELYLNKVGTIGWSIRNNGSFNVFNWQDSSFPLTILDNDNVGIGTSAPANKLEVTGDIGLSSNFNSLHFMSAAGAGDLYLDVEPGTRTLRTRNWNTGSPNVSATRFHTGSVLAEESVGIGTTTPGARLHVRAGDIIKETMSGFDGPTDNLIKYMANGDPTNGNVNRWIGLDATITAGADVDNKLLFRVYRGNAAQDQPPLTAMTLLGNGNVGIGTTAPGVALDVIGSMRSTTGLSYQTADGVPWWINGGANGPAVLLQSHSALGGPSNRRGSLGWMDNNGLKYEFLTWSDAGTIGIGTTTAAQELTVGGGVSHAVAITGDAGAQYLLLGNQNSGGANNPALIAGANGGLYFGHGSSWGDAVGGTPTYGMALLTSGNVGIGTTNPASKLEVAGNAQVDGALTVSGSLSAPGYVANSGAVTGGSTGLALNAGGTNQNVTISPSGSGATVLNGSVGIGTTTPSNPLTIVDPGQNAVPATVPPSYVGAYIQRTYSTSSAAGLAIQGSIKATGGTGRLFLGNADEYDSSEIEGGSGTLTFAVRNSGAALAEAMRIQPSGYVGIGTSSPDTPLTVKGRIHAAEVVVDATVTAADLKVQPKAWADDVLAPSHPLEPLSQVESQIEAEGHLPGIPSAQEVATHGVSVADMQVRLLAKIEELTLHQIEQEKHMHDQDARIQKLETENAALRAQLK